VETKANLLGNPKSLLRYQFGNHLGSASLELDEDAKEISYEEYHPYGSSAYQGVRNQNEAPKRYRYTGKERDEESGFYYHGIRYYASWLGRWISCDPAKLIDGVNVFAYVSMNPMTYVDPTGSAAADWARKWEEGPKQEYRAWLATQLTPETRSEEYLGLAVTTLAVELGAGLVDLGHLGEGAAEGGVRGYISDAIRVVGIATLAWGAARTSGLTGGGAKAPNPVTEPVTPEVPTAKAPPVSEAAPVPKPAPATEPSMPAMPEQNYIPNPNIRPHGQQPSPRPTGTQSHHPEQQSALSRNIANYGPREDPALLMSTPSHQATFAPQAAQRATGAAFERQLGTPAALEEATQIMEQAGVSPATAGQTVMEHSGYLFSTTPVNEVLMCLPP